MPKDTVQTLVTKAFSERAGEDVMGYLLVERERTP